MKTQKKTCKKDAGRNAYKKENQETLNLVFGCIWIHMHESLVHPQSNESR